jgi:hypothetical protein
MQRAIGIPTAKIGIKTGAQKINRAMSLSNETPK